jgi:hypothetical protein
VFLCVAIKRLTKRGGSLPTLISRYKDLRER